MLREKRAICRNERFESKFSDVLAFLLGPNEVNVF